MSKKCCDTRCVRLLVASLRFDERLLYMTDTTASTNGADVSPQTDPEVIKKLTALRMHVRESFGKVVMALMALPRYRHQSIADLQHLVLDPLIRDRVAMAYEANEDQANDVAGMAIWASVSDEVDRKIREQIKAGIWPLRLKPDDWTSGEINWLLDVIAPDQKTTTRVLANFKQVVKDGDLRLHPLIARLVDRDTLEKMGASDERRPSDAEGS